MQIVGSIALLMFIWGGIVWMTSQGEKARVEKGQKTLAWAVIGLAVIFVAYAGWAVEVGTPVYKDAAGKYYAWVERG